MTAIEDRITADLEHGRHDQLLPELTGLVHGHPTNERLCGQLMMTLYRLGRQAEALAVYRECRERLAEELGVDPGPELSELHRSILRGAGGATDPGAVPAQLPHLTGDFTGRAGEVGLLLNALDDTAVHAIRAIHAISGRGGIGKSTLAIRAAHDLAPSYPDGQLFAELRGMSDTPATASEVLGRFLRALGVDPAHVPESAQERAELYRTLLAGRKMLVVLDDAAQEEQVLPLLPGAAGCAVIVTSRHRLGGLPGARHLELDVMTPAESLQLLHNVIGEDRVGAEGEAALRIVEYCGRLPLAIRVAGARLANRRRLPLGWFADRLADERHRLNELSPGDLGIRASVGLSYRALNPRARQALRRLGHFGVPDFAGWVLAWLVGEPIARGEELAEELVDAQLLEFVGPDQLGNLRYRMHDLVRLYARERAEREESPRELQAAVRRVLGGWLAVIARSAAELPGDDVRWQHRIAEPPVVPSPEVADPRTWFEAERRCMVAGIERAAALGLHDLACAFTPEEHSLVFAGPERFSQRTRIINAVLDAARAAGDLAAEAMMLADYGLLQYLRDEYAEARLAFFHALSRFRDLGDAHGEAATLARLGTSCREAGRLTEALHFLELAARLLTELGEETGIAYVRRVCGSVRLEQGAFAEALTDLWAALRAYQTVGSRRGEGLTLRSLSLHHRALGRFGPAAELAARSREVFRELGDELLEAYAARSLAKATLRLGRTGEALDLAQGSLAVSIRLNDAWGQGVTMRVLGEIHLAAGALDAAEAWLGSALEAWRRIEAPLWLARTQKDLAAVHAARGEAKEAERLRESALSLFQAHGAREFHELSTG
jgi:tetratricopeptide (TPR) repeat protein